MITPPELEAVMPEVSELPLNCLTKSAATSVTVADLAIQVAVQVLRS